MELESSHDDIGTAWIGLIIRCSATETKII